MSSSHLSEPLSLCVIQDIRVPPFKMWKPDILLYNSANENFDATYPTKIVVSHNGELQQVPPGVQHIKRFK